MNEAQTPARVAEFVATLSLATDLSWVPTEQLRLSAFASRDRYDSAQSGRSFRGTVPADLTDPARNWQVDAREWILFTRSL